MTLKIMTYNINYSRRASSENGWGFYEWSKRAPTIYQIIKSHNPDILMIQELHNDYVIEFQQTLNDYNWFITKQNSRGGITNIAIGAKNTLDNLEFGEYNFNQYNNDDENENGIGNIFNLENTAYCIHRPTETLFLSIHFPMELADRKKFSDVLQNLTNKFQCVIIGGDFNSFPNMWGYQQIIKINGHCGTHSLSEFALYKSDGSFATKSFIPYPYDFVPKNALNMIGKLDHILGKNVVLVENAIVDDSCIEGTNIIPSDHMPIICIIETNTQSRTQKHILNT